MQIRVFRSIVGWVRIPDDLSWWDIMVQMNHKLAMKTVFLMEGWEDRLLKTDPSDRTFDLHIGLHAHLKDGGLNLFLGIR